MNYITANEPANKPRRTKKRLSWDSIKVSSRVSADFEPTVRRHRADLLFLVFTIILVLLGMVVIYSIGPALASKQGLDQNHYMYKQLTYIFIAGVVFFVTSRMPIRWWAKFQPVAIIAATVGCLALLIPHVGQAAYGATRWINLGPINFQPAELVKFALVLYLAQFFTQRIKDGTLNDKHATLYPFGIIMLVIGIVVAVLQKDLGTMITVVILMLTMIYFAGLSYRNLGIIFAVIAIGGVLSVAMFPHRLSRITTFLHPEQGADTSSYQINQALIAVGSGGITGKGIGRSVQAYGYLPEAANDSIFAIMSEKFGFIGTTVVIGIFGALLWRMLRIVQYSSSIYSQLLAAGIFGWVMAHVVVNIAAILGLMPLTGITLPFISFGGTSLVFIMAGLGIMFQISRYTYHELPFIKEVDNAHLTSGGRFGRTRNASGHGSWQAHTTSSR